MDSMSGRQAGRRNYLMIELLYKMEFATKLTFREMRDPLYF